MLLNEWLVEQDLNFSEAARLFKCSRPSVHYYANGKMRPGPKLCQRIFKITDGKVTANDHQQAYEAHHECKEQGERARA